MTHYETRRSRSYDEGEDVASLKQIIKDQQRRISELEAENERLKMEKVLGHWPGAAGPHPVGGRRAARPHAPRSIRRVADADAGAPRAAAGRRALQRATRRQRKPEPRYVEPPPGTPPPPGRRAAADAARGSAHPPEASQII